MKITQRNNDEGYQKDVPVQTEFLSLPSELKGLTVINETICLYD